MDCEKKAYVTVPGLRKKLRAAYKALRAEGGWRAVGRAFGISGGMAYRIAMEGYEPADAAIRHGLGLPVRRVVEACPVCGEVHVAKRCTQRRKTTRRWRDLPVEALRLALEQREEWDEEGA